MDDTENNNGAAISEVSAISGQISVIPVTDESNGAGRPTKYNEATVAQFCEALANGMNKKSACAVASVGVQTAADWEKEHPEFKARVDAANEKLREKCLKVFAKALDDNDWRAAEAIMKLRFPEYRQSSKVEVSATATAATGFLVLTEERQRELQARRAAALGNRTPGM